MGERAEELLMKAHYDDAGKYVGAEPLNNPDLIGVSLGLFVSTVNQTIRYITAGMFAIGGYQDRWVYYQLHGLDHQGTVLVMKRVEDVRYANTSVPGFVWEAPPDTLLRGTEGEDLH